MIHLRSDCLVFELANGDTVPCSAESVTVQLIGDAIKSLDAELVQHAAAAVLHHFKYDLQRSSVTVAEFSENLEAVLRSLGLEIQSASRSHVPRTAESDLRLLAYESGKAFELGFFLRLRKHVLRELEYSPEILRFNGLRSCVKQLVGAKRWTSRCQALSDQIVEFLRICLCSERRRCGLIVQ